MRQTEMTDFRTNRSKGYRENEQVALLLIRETIPYVPALRRRRSPRGLRRAGFETLRSWARSGAVPDACPHAAGRASYIYRAATLYRSQSPLTRTIHQTSRPHSDRRLSDNMAAKVSPPFRTLTRRLSFFFIRFAAPLNSVDS